MRLVEILARELEEWPDGETGAVQSRVDLEIYFDRGFSFFATDAADDRDEWDNPVTREMWEAERARLVGDVEWDGEGLPPVGAVCLGLSECDGEWEECEIVSHHKGAAVAVFPHGGAMVSRGARYRPAPSAEQIAAKDREEALEDMRRIYLEGASGHTGGLAALYDAGYRKQESNQ